MQNVINTIRSKFIASKLLRAVFETNLIDLIKQCWREWMKIDLWKKYIINHNKIREDFEYQRELNEENTNM